MSKPPEMEQPQPERKRSQETQKLLLVLIGGILIGVVITQAIHYRRSPIESRPDGASAFTAPVSTPPGSINLDSEAALAALSGDDSLARQNAVELFAARGDRRIIAPLLVIMHLAGNSIVPPLTQKEYESLVRLSGQDFGLDWRQWSEWWWSQDDAPEHLGFPLFQANIYSRIDSTFTELMHSYLPTTIRRDEIVWGGVRFDGIPALIEPEVAPAGSPDAAIYEESEPVFGIAFNGEARAYPLRIMDWHEMVNDTVGGRRFFISYCTLCGSAVAYDAIVPGMGRLIFGSSGFLRRSNKLMYDRATHSLWSAIEGRPLLGPLAQSHPELRLGRLPVVRTSWGEWKRRHPETTVLTVNTGYDRDYKPGRAYGEYFASPDTMFPVAQRNDRLKAKDWVFALLLNGQPKAYPLAAFRESPVLHDSFAGLDIVLIGFAELKEVRAYQSDGRRFSLDARGELRDEQDGALWSWDEVQISGPGGVAFPRLPGHLAYWFGWYAAFESTELYSAP
ncbi:DUF3179 domain-containing protein [Candidatus Sumerlaeota bacterium]|nr:DUF3179 domain-containing protein [Candidatus Sumerlaeota bacterium]